MIFKLITRLFVAVVLVGVLLVAGGHLVRSAISHELASSASAQSQRACPIVPTVPRTNSIGFTTEKYVDQFLNRVLCPSS